MKLWRPAAQETMHGITIPAWGLEAGLQQLEHPSGMLTTMIPSACRIVLEVHLAEGSPTLGIRSTTTLQSAAARDLTGLNLLLARRSLKVLAQLLREVRAGTLIGAHKHVCRIAKEVLRVEALRKVGTFFTQANRHAAAKGCHGVKIVSKE